MSGSYAYVGDFPSGLHVVDVSNPAAPQIVGSIVTPGSAYDVALAGSYVYIADSDSLQVFPRQCEAAAVGVDIVSGEPFPAGLLLKNNFPNPFTTSTRIDYVLPASGNAHLALYDLHGRRVVSLMNRVQTPGHHSVHWDTRSATGRLSTLR